MKLPLQSEGRGCLEEGCLGLPGVSQTFFELRERKKHIKNKTHKQNFPGIVPGFWGNFVYVFFLPHKEGPEKTHKQIFGTHPVPGQSRKFIGFSLFST